MSNNPISRNTIQIGEKKRRSIFRYIYNLVKVVVVLSLWISCSYYTVTWCEDIRIVLNENLSKIKSEVYSRMKIVDKPEIAVEETQENVDSVLVGELVKNKSEKYKLNPAVLMSVMDQESDFNPTRIRYEQSWKDQYQKQWPKTGNMTSIEYDLLFSSIGLMQIGYGLHRNTCEIKHFTELLNPEKNVDCAARILRMCLDRNSNLRPGMRVRRCVREYNGTGPKAEAYAEIVMSKIDDYLIESSKEKLFLEINEHSIKMSMKNEKKSRS